jgi:allantoinase
VWISGGLVAAVKPTVDPAATPGVERVDVGEAFVLPGVIDAHVHCLSHTGEGVRAATSAAAAGGVTTIIEMPFDKAGPINNLDRLHAKQDMVNDEALIDVALLGTLAPDGGWRNAEGLVGDGAVGFKISLFLTDPQRFPRISDLELLSVMAAITEAGSTLCVHAENNEIIKGLIAREPEPGDTDPFAHIRTRPPISETLAVLTALEVAAEKGTALHLCHLSLPRSIDLAGWYQQQGTNVTMETCPHYLTFTQDDMNVQRGHLKINPPLRPLTAREGMWDRLGDGRIAVISSDHAPWPLEFKDHERMLENHSGVPGVETLVAVTLGQALARDPSLRLFNAAVKALTETPAQRFGLQAHKGSLAPGKDADITVFSPGPQAIDGSALHSNAGWSPYDGFAPGGVVSHAFSRGKLVWSTAAGLLAKAGDGEILTRN